MLIFADPLEENPPPPSGSGIFNAVSEGIDNSGQTDVTNALQALIGQASQAHGDKVGDVFKLAAQHSDNPEDYIELTDGRRFPRKKD